MITRTAFPVALVALALSPGFVTLRADDKPAAAAVAPSRLAEDLTGVWVLVGRPGAVREAPEAGGRLKFRTGRHWVMTQADPKTGVVVMHDGGTYTLEGERYSETLEYANPSTMGDLKKTFNYTVKVEGDTMTQIGLGNPYTETWKRVK
jgi:hypothetical protein